MPPKETKEQRNPNLCDECYERRKNDGFPVDDKFNKLFCYHKYIEMLETRREKGKVITEPKPSIKKSDINEIKTRPTK